MTCWHRHKVLLLFIGLLVTYPIGLRGWAAQEPGPGNKEVIRVGVIGPMRTDDHAESHYAGVKAKFESMKEDVERGMELRLELVEADSSATESETEADRALAIAKDMVENKGVIAILGAVNSSATLKIRDYVERSVPGRVILITSSSTNTRITAADNNWTFRNNLSDSKLTSQLAHYIYDRGIENLAVFFYDNEWGRGAYQDFERAYRGRNGKIIYPYAIPEGTRRFEDAIARLADHKDVEGLCIFAGDIAKESIFQAKLAEPRTSDMPAFTIGIPHRLLNYDQKAIRQLTAVSSYYDEPDSPTIQTAKKMLWNQFHDLHITMNFNSARAIESTELLLNAIRQVGRRAVKAIPDVQAIRDEIRSTSLRGFSYNIEFDPKTGDLKHATPYFLNHYGQWLDLSNPRVYITPILTISAIVLVFVLTYCGTAKMCAFLPRQSLFASALPATFLLWIANSKHWISIGQHLSDVSEIVTWCGAIVTVGLFMTEVLNRTSLRMELPESTKAASS